MINKKLLSLFLSSIALVSSFQFSYADNEKIKTAKLIKNTLNGQIDWLNRVIRVKGQSALPDVGGIAQKRLKARVGARMEAYRNLAELVSGVQVSSESTVNNFVTESDIVKLRVDAVVKGARQSGREKILSDGSIEVELYLPMFGNGSLASALDLGNYAKNKSTLANLLPYMVATTNDFAIVEEKQKEKKSYKISENNLSNITGLIIDASNLAVEPAMAPFIIGGGRIIYTGSKIDIDPETIVKYGITEYTDDIEKAKKNIDRVGKSPLVIEASGATGNPTKTNILLDEINITNLLEANEKTKFLSKLGVLIVI
ncbi:MAG: hypothetical protein U0354_02935 [Candidatus Sericytochromatia bacterium]